LTLKWRVRFSLFIGILLCENQFSTHATIGERVAAVRMPTASAMQAKINF
jgi:hypothetical protein